MEILEWNAINDSFTSEALMNVVIVLRETERNSAVNIVHSYCGKKGFSRSEGEGEKEKASVKLAFIVSFGPE